MSLRPTKRLQRAQPATEGAGVRLRRAFGFGDTEDFDPFLLLDDFRNDRPEDYQAGFPWHPHRGIETITYVLSGAVDHADSLGNADTIGAGQAPPTPADDRCLVVFDSGDEVTVQSGEQGIRFLLVSGQPIKEPVAWYGPVVMNTQEELQQAFDELQAGTFLQHDDSPGGH